MASKNSDKTLADYVAIAISPVLIMALVGSLVFFLVAVLYHGDHADRLHWILFFFVFGAVLVARISMQGDIADRAGLYGIILGLLVWIALLTYVDWGKTGPLAPFGWAIDLGLIAIVWWCAHRLTWDCTMIDDTVDASGAGLLQVAGLEKTPGQAGSDKPGQAVEEKRTGKAASEPRGLIGWWERYLRYRDEQRRKPHTPGVWVVYFSLAALPLFGLGQALIEPEDTPRRQYVFWLMTIYVGSGLGLLLTTSFLGLRRYLRQRKLKMPVAMTGVWLMVGAILIATLLFLGAFLPRPIPEYRALEWSALLGSPERKASKWNQKKDRAGKDKGSGAGEHKDSKDKGGDDGNRKDPDKDGEASGKEGETRNENGSGSKADKAGKGDRKQQDKDNKDGDPDAKDKEAKEGIGENQEKPKDQGERSDSQSGNEQDSSAQKPPSNFMPELGRQLATLLKWVIGIILGLVVLFVLLRAGLRFLANFTHWARRLLAALQAFWQGLSGWWGSRTSRTDDEAEPAETAEPAPFASFRDPFVSGSAERMSHAQLVRYTFEALHAWACERSLARQAGETPLEFARRLEEEVPALESEVQYVANYYVQIAYGHVSLTKSCREPLRRLWRRLVEVAERPMSAGVGNG